jgi:hypothetical protein
MESHTDCVTVTVTVLSSCKTRRDMADARQRTIIKVSLLAYLGLVFTLSQVFRKYSNSLGPDTLELLETILDNHEIEDADVESSIETIAREYNKQDGVLQYLDVSFVPLIVLSRRVDESVGRRSSARL